MTLLHHWDLQEASGTTATDSVGGNNGTLDGSVAFGAAGPGGSLARAADFTGSSISPITLASPVVLPTNEDWSVSFWAKTAVLNDDGIVAGSSSGDNGFFWIRDDLAKVQIKGDDGSGGFITITQSSFGVFKLHTALNTGSTGRVDYYIGGVLEAGRTLGADLTIDTLGNGKTASSSALVGSLLDFRIYDNQLTPAEIAVLLALATTVPPNLSGQFFQNINPLLTGTGMSVPVRR